MTGGPELLLYDLGRDVKAFSTCRHGGYSEGPYASFNANAYCGDDEAHVNQNRALLCEALGIDSAALVIPHQIHQDRVLKVDRSFVSLKKETRDEALEGVDALMTDESGICIGVSTADCIPLFFYDPAHRAVAAVHAGWRGTVRRIVMTVLQRMAEAYHTHAQELKVVIGPGISLKAFEVGDEVYDIFVQSGFPMSRIAGLFPVDRAGKDGLRQKWHIDLSAANQWLLEQAGVSAANIYQSGICTYTCNERFFSARRLGIASGRILNGIFLVE